MVATKGFSGARLERMSKRMRAYVERGEVAGLVTLLCRHDEVHAEATGAQDLSAGTPMQRDTIFRVASMTKPVTAAAAMILVEETRLRLDDPVDELLPELSNRRVLRSINSPLEDTVPAKRAITLRDLLTFRWGLGAVMAPPDQYPIQKAIAAAGLAPGPKMPSFGADELMRRYGTLPLLHQPGEGWRYHSGADVLGVLIERASGMKLEDFMKARILEPLGMKDTAFSVPEARVDRLATCYQRDAGTGKLEVFDEARGGMWSRPPAFASGGGGLASTVDDFLAFGRMMLNHGRNGADRLLSRTSVELMTTDHLTPQQKAASPFSPGFWDNNGWGFGASVVTRRDSLSLSPGSYGWIGGFHTVWFNDPREDMVLILLLQRVMTSPNTEDITTDFLTLAYQAIDD